MKLTALGEKAWSLVLKPDLGGWTPHTKNRLCIPALAELGRRQKWGLCTSNFWGLAPYSLLLLPFPL